MCKSQDGSLNFSSCVLDIQRSCYLEGKSQRSWANLLLFNSPVSCKIFSALGFLLVTIMVIVNMKTCLSWRQKNTSALLDIEPQRNWIVLGCYFMQTMVNTNFSKKYLKGTKQWYHGTVVHVVPYKYHETWMKKAIVAWFW